MRLHRCVTAALMAPLFLVGVLTAHASPGAQGVTVALLPSQQVAPGGTFDLYIEVTQAGSLFNGFDAVIGYDPAALTFVPGSNQNGSYLTSACTNLWNSFHAGADYDSITTVLLCPDLTVPGPGQLYRLSFQASMTPQETEVRFWPGSVKFFNAGLYVHPVTSSNVLIGVGMDVGVEPPAPPQRLALRAAPNPSPGSLVFTVESGRAGPENLTVLDVQGRTVRRFAESRTAPGVHTIAWDGRDDAGATLPPGVYLARLEIAGRAVWSRVALIR